MASFTVYVMFFLTSQLAMIFAHEHISKYQRRTYPKSLYECHNMPVTFGKVSQEQEKQQIISYLDCFKGDTLKKMSPNISQETVNQFNEVLRRMQTGHWRVKRQAGFPRSRMRREVRMHTPAEWRYVTRRFNIIYRNGALREIVSFHNDTAILGAHGGPAFLGWHRILLLWIEYYLWVPIPYWDSTLDFHITDPRRSILWTRFFFGNGRGTVRTGPFRSFTEPNGNRISRFIAGSGTLIARENVESIMNRNSNRELIYTSDITLEGYHNGPHVWVGRTLARIIAAPADPCFWFHHSFVDKLWRDVQGRMSNREEYPFEAISHPSQHPRAIMAMFPVDPDNPFYPLLNEHGYNDSVAASTVYERSPGQATFPFQCRNPAWRNRRVLNWDRQRGFCVTGEGHPRDFVTPPEVQANRFASASSAAAFNDGSNSELMFSSPLADIRTDEEILKTQGANSFNAANNLARSRVFDNTFTSELMDVRTDAAIPALDPPIRQPLPLRWNEIIEGLRRQQGLLAQVPSSSRSASFLNQIDLTPGMNVPVVNNVLPQQQFVNFRIL